MAIRGDVYLVFDTLSIEESKEHVAIAIAVALKGLEDCCEGGGEEGAVAALSWLHGLGNGHVLLAGSAGARQRCVQVELSHRQGGGGRCWEQKGDNMSAKIPK
jgi:hypothetical protein